MNRVAEIQEHVWASQSCAQIAFAHAQATHLAQFVFITGSRLIKQTIIPVESMASKMRFKTADRPSVRDLISGSGKNFQPDRIELQAFQAKHPLQWNGKYSPTLAVFRGKSAAEENSHPKK